MKKLSLIFIVCLVGLSMVLSACGSSDTTAPLTTPSTPVPATTTPAQTATPSSTPQEDKYGGTLRMAVTTGPSTPIGLPSEATPDSQVAAAPALESLVSIKMDGTIVPVLATSWEVANDKKSISLTLRQGVQFHDGSVFNAEICKWNIDMMIEAQRVRDWESVDILGDYSIRVNLKEYKNTTFSNLSAVPQVSKKAFDERGAEWVRWNPVGTGAFVFESYERDAKLTYKRNSDYWDNGLPYLDSLEIRVIADETIRKLSFLRGDIHMITPQGLTAKELDDAGYSKKEMPGGTFVLIPCSTEKDTPWSKLEVRQAASYALNREALARALGFGFARAAYQLYGGHQMAAIPDLDKHEYNPDKARELLASAGYPDGFKANIHNFVQIVPADYGNAVASQLRAVGIDITVEFPEAGKYMSDATAGWDDGLMSGCYASYPTNTNEALEVYFLGYFYSSQERTETLLSAIHASLTSEFIEPELIQAAIRVVHDEVLLIPYLEEIKVNFYRDGVHDDGADEYSLMSLVARYAWLDKQLR